MNNYGKKLLDIKQPVSRAPAHVNVFEVTTNWCLGDMDDMKDEVTYIHPQYKEQLLEALNWAHINHLDEMDVFSVEKEFPEEYGHFCEMFGHYPNESSSCMLYNLDGVSIVYYDHLGVSRECKLVWEA